MAIISTDLESKTKKKIIEDSGSGHRAIITTTQLNLHTNKKKQKTLPKWNFKKANWTKYRKVTNKLFQEIDLKQNINKIVKDLNNTILKAANLSIPRGKTYKYKPFWNKQLSQQKTIRDNFRKKAEQTKNESDVIEWRKASAQLKQNIKVAKKNSFEKFITELDYRTNSSKIHKYIKQLNNNMDDYQNKLLIVNNKEIYEDSKIAEKFATYYKNANKLNKNKKLNKHLNKQRLNKKDTTELQNIFNVGLPFSVPEIKQAIRTLKNKKNPGPDNIHAEFLKNFGQEALEILLIIFNKIRTNRNNKTHKNN